MTRRGTTLVEILAALPLIVATVALFSSLFPDMVLVPGRLQSASQTSVGLSSFAASVRRDVEAAVSIPAEFAGRRTDGNTLLMELPEGTVCYEAGGREGEIVRLGLRPLPDGGREVTDCWSLSGSVFSFELLEDDNAPCAVALRTGVMDRPSGQEKLRTAEVFFPLGLRRDEE